jgi:hypothetical protein
VADARKRIAQALKAITDALDEHAETAITEAVESGTICLRLESDDLVPSPGPPPLVRFWPGGDSEGDCYASLDDIIRDEVEDLCGIRVGTSGKLRTYQSYRSMLTRLRDVLRQRADWIDGILAESLLPEPK